jgi:hypothetical protein
MVKHRKQAVSGSGEDVDTEAAFGGWGSGFMVIGM